MEHEEGEFALRLGGALRWFWYMGGYYREGRRWLEAVLAKDGRASAEARAKALEGVGWLANLQGDLDRAEAAAEEGLKLSAEAGLGEMVVAWLPERAGGRGARHRGDYERAEELLEESLELYREVGGHVEASRGLWVVWPTWRATAVTTSRRRTLRRRPGPVPEIGRCEFARRLLDSLGYEYLLEGNLRELQS